MWSIGCILHQLLFRQTAFRPESVQDYIQQTLNVLGPVPSHLVDKITDNDLKAHLQFENSKVHSKSSHFANMPCNKLAVDLMLKLLTFDPEERLSAEEALAHPFLAELHDPADEPAGEPFDKFDFEFEFFNTDIDVLRDQMLDEMVLWNS